MSYILLKAGPPAGESRMLAQPNSEQKTEFYSALGQAIAAWQQVEVIVYLLFVHTIKPSHKQALSASFYQVTNFSTQLSMLSHAMEARYGLGESNVDLIKRWTGLSNKISKKSKSRNKVAHYLVYFDEEEKNLKRQMFLAPAITGPGQDANLVRRSGVRSNELEQMAETFEKLRDEIFEFSQFLPEPMRT